MAENPFLHTPDAALREAWFRPMGLSLRLTSDSPAIVAAATSAFGGFGPAASTEPATLSLTGPLASIHARGASTPNCQRTRFFSDERR